MALFLICYSLFVLLPFLLLHPAADYSVVDSSLFVNSSRNCCTSSFPFFIINCCFCVKADHSALESRLVTHLQLMSAEHQQLSARCDAQEQRSLEYSGGSSGPHYEDVKTELVRVTQELKCLQGSNAQIRVGFCNLSLNHTI